MNLNFIRVGIVAIALAFSGCCFAQDKTAGYDMGGCAPDEFVAAHVEIGTHEITVISVSLGPDQVIKLDKPVVYKLTKTDEDGKHYLDEAKGGLELVISKADNEVIVGKFLDPDEPEWTAVVFGVPADGSKLAENAKEEFETCKDIRLKHNTKADMNVSKT
jgi:hypothetical protein